MNPVETTIRLEDKRKHIKLGKDFFLFQPEVEVDAIKESQKNNRLFALNLPEEYSENFLSPDNITLYLLDYLKYFREKQSDVKFEKETLRDHILRWFLVRDRKEKEGIFNYLLKVSKTQNLSSIDDVLLVTFLIREIDRIKDDKLIEDRLNSALDKPPHSKVKLLNSILDLAKVFYHIKLEEWETAGYSINEVEAEGGLKHNTEFYSLIINLNLGDVEAAKEYLYNIIKYDKERVDYAIRKFHAGFYDTMLNNSFTKNLFAYSEGTLLADEIGNLYTVANENYHILTDISQFFKVIQLNKYDTFKDQEIFKKIDFLKFISIKYASSKNYLFLSSIPTLRSEILIVVEEILSNIKQYFDDIVTDSLKRYDEKIESIRDALDRSERDKNEVLKKEEEKNGRLTKDFDEKINAEIKYYQDMFDKYDSQQDSSTSAVFKNAFAYNLIFALFVLLAGGFAEYSNYYLHEIASLAGFLSIVVSGGLKWGFISFILGSIVSVIAFINSVYDRYTAKNNLSQKINSLNLEKERAKTAFHAKVEEKRQTIINRFEKAREKMNNEIAELKEAKVEERQKKIESLKEEQDSYIQPLYEILANK